MHEEFDSQPLYLALNWKAFQAVMDGMQDLKSFSGSPQFFCGGRVAQVPLFLWFTLFLGKEEILQIIIDSDTASIIPSYWFFLLASGFCRLRLSRAIQQTDSFERPKPNIPFPSLSY